MVVHDKLSTYQLSMCAIIVMVCNFWPRLIPLPKNMGTYYILCNYNIFQGLNMWIMFKSFPTLTSIVPPSRLVGLVLGQVR